MAMQQAHAALSFCPSSSPLSYNAATAYVRLLRQQLTTSSKKASTASWSASSTATSSSTSKFDSASLTGAALIAILRACVPSISENQVLHQARRVQPPARPA
ncbi:hypothetical protein FIBSPDRAFT_252463 [Athelia psychrophila]|uniref:Uncharacterized protein n=1 Tax=Athelia psychrophila TaxID=1759441 RepID=A0A165XR27_9AGAM|nr:hypothetical protein FIBSPDRAFT_252463 [Fibularhizoctonia sp. CBS 109695]